MGLFKYTIEKYTPKQLVIIPLALLAVSLLLLAFSTLTTGTPVQLGIDFSGGTAVNLFTTDSKETLQSHFAGYPLNSISEGVNDGKFLTFSATDDATFRELSALIAQKYPDAQINQIGETFGKTLQYQAVLALIFSFIGMVIVIFISFRTFVPAGAVVLSAFADMAITAEAMNSIGLQLTMGTVAALLMLIGYSVDSDILLTNRVLKRQGKLHDKLQGAFHTGIIMTSTTLAAVAAMFIVSWIGSVQILMEISAVLLIGLVADILNTWLTNAAILKWYVQKGDGK
ncbi:MAG: Protein-export membrane protein SecF [Methanoregula sp. SKADARSKE-2]|nr:MAG: Protein-export membrane protein SecF [Methanoregula sp. SKADARSKE-2]